MSATPQSVSLLDKPITNKHVLDLIERNHEEYDVFFANNLHNHFPHTLLSIYALGADDKRLDKEWDAETYRRPLAKQREYKLDETNWTACIGDSSYYPNYLSFFEGQIKEHGVIPTLIKYGWSKELFGNLLAGVGHPLIHIGFGIEFDLPGVVAEGLAEACGQNNKLTAPLLTRVDERLCGESRSMIELLQAIYRDPSLDGIITHSDEDKAQKVVNAASDTIKRYMDLWLLPVDEASVAKSMEDLYIGAMYLYATTAFGPHATRDSKEQTTLDPNSVKLDFFLLHILTSALAVRVLLPHLSVAQAGVLMKSHLSTALLYYIARGRPPMRPDLLAMYMPSTREIRELNSWSEVKKLTPQSFDLHVPKVVRTLLIGYENYAKSNAQTSHNEKESLWFKAAVLTLDYWLGVRKSDWEFDAPGFPEHWK
jgi:hypothetical protein